MKAMHGFAVSYRSRGKLIGCCLALVLVASAILASGASAAKTPLTPASYIGMGDSLAFGYTQQKFEENYPAESPTAFEGGYVTLLGKKIAAKEKKNGFAVTSVNLGCPGEVSDGLIGENPSLGGGGEGGGKPDSKPCAYHNEDGFPRHFEYGSSSQLEASIGLVSGKPFGETKYVTINIGSNDELAVVHACLSESYEASRGMTKGVNECLSVEAGPPAPEEGKEEFEGDMLKGHQYYKGGLFPHIITNVGTAIFVLREVAHFGGEIGVLGFYNPQAIVLPGSDSLQIELNKAFEEEIGGGAFGPGVVYANPFKTFNPQKGTVKEQAAICKYTEYCNVHDKEANYVKYLEAHGFTHEQAEAYKESHKAEAEAFPEGDIHPTPLGYKVLATDLFKALGFTH
jgi:lysophospholipase L1-like esterase